MEIHLNNYFKTDSMSEAIEKLKLAVKTKEQSKLYDYIYIDFLRNITEYDENTIIPKLHLMVKIFIFAFYYRHLIYNDTNIINIPDNCKIWLLSLMNNENYSTNVFMKLCFQFVSMVKDKCKFNDDGSPIILSSKNRDIIPKKFPIFNNKQNKYFYCPLVGKAGLLSFNSISEFLYDSLINNDFSKIPLSVMTHNSTKSPHDNNYTSPLEMLFHDLGHIYGTTNFLNHVNIEELKTLYDIIPHNNIYFSYRMFCVIIWYIFFEISQSSPDIIYYSVFKLINDFLERRSFLSLVDGSDQIYVISYLRNSNDFPEDLIEMADNVVIQEIVNTNLNNALYRKFVDSLPILKPKYREW